MRCLPSRNRHPRPAPTRGAGSGGTGRSTSYAPRSAPGAAPSAQAQRRFGSTPERVGLRPKTAARPDQDASRSCPCVPGPARASLALLRSSSTRARRSRNRWRRRPASRLHWVDLTRSPSHARLVRAGDRRSSSDRSASAPATLPARTDRTECGRSGTRPGRASARQHDDVGRTLGQPGERLLAAGRLDDLEAAFPQCVRGEQQS